VFRNKRISRAAFIKSSLVLGGATALAACNLPAPAPTALTPSAATHTTGAEDRAYWLATLQKIVDPVLNNLAQGTLKAKMPLQTRPGLAGERGLVTHLEAVGRLLAGIAPWLELSALSGSEEELRKRYASLATVAITTILDPQSPDYIDFIAGRQNIVDSAYLAHAMLRAPNALWKALSPLTQKRLITSLKATRVLEPYINNWLLFNGMIEAFLYWVKEDWDRTRMDNALHQHETWYKGDGVYGDGLSSTGITTTAMSSIRCCWTSSQQYPAWIPHMLKCKPENYRAHSVMLSFRNG